MDEHQQHILLKLDEVAHIILRLDHPPPQLPNGIVFVKPMTVSGTSAEAKNFSRQQFPIQLAFAVTVWKAQGATLEQAAIFLDKLKKPKHGLIYTALSRVKRFRDLVITQKLYDYVASTDDLFSSDYRKEWVENWRQLLESNAASSSNTVLINNLSSTTASSSFSNWNQ